MDENTQNINPELENNDTVEQEDIKNQTEENQQEKTDHQANTTELELAEMKDKYLRLYSEFDNFRRRTAKERIDLLGSATQDLMTALIPIIDDFERGMVTMEKSDNVASVKEGVELIFTKFKKTLESKGLKPMENTVGKALDPELHEAITQAPAPTDELKGKIMDEIEKGYYLNDKIIRYAKVVIGA